MKCTTAAALLVALSAQALAKPFPPSTGKLAGLALREASARHSLEALQKRAVCTEDQLDELVDNSEDVEAPGPEASGGDAGMGVEFESAYVQMEANPECSFDDKNKAKGRIINGRKGDNWQLTADLAGYADLEYHIIGTTAKIGTGVAVPAAKAISNDAIDFHPRVGQIVEIEDNPCTWTVSVVTIDDPAEWKWSPQLTVPMPLEAVNEIIALSVAGQDSPFLGRIKNAGWTSVTKDFFQSKPGGIEPDSVTDDVLGFFSLLVSYAKVARAMDEEEALHHLLPIMPRSDFVAQYFQVSAKLQGKDLYEIVTILACYQNGASSLDEKFCTGELGSPSPTGQMDQQTFTVWSGDQQWDLKAKDWITSLTGDGATDKLAALDKNVRGAFGGFGSLTEKMVDSDRKVALYEFRRLASVKTTDIEAWTKEREDAIILYHRKYSTQPSKKHKKRQDCEVGLLENKCRVEAILVPNPADNDNPYLGYTMYNQKWEQSGDNFGTNLPVGQKSDGIGGLGPLIYATIKDSDSDEWPMDVDFEYDDQRFSWLADCTLMSTSNLGQGVEQMSRSCQFDCRG